VGLHPRAAASARAAEFGRGGSQPGRDEHCQKGCGERNASRAQPGCGKRFPYGSLRSFSLWNFGWLRYQGLASPASSSRAAGHLTFPGLTRDAAGMAEAEGPHGREFSRASRERVVMALEIGASGMGVLAA